MNPTRKPDWLKVKIPSGSAYGSLTKTLDKYNLHTVCDEASCPNKAECWGEGTATFMILGDTCTRSCRFCGVSSCSEGVAVDEREPENLAKAIKEMGLDYAVLTSVTRDDLADHGASHYASCIKAVRQENPRASIEVLIPDFAGDPQLLGIVCDASPDVIAHNIETVARLTPAVRDMRAGYETSLNVLSNAKEMSEGVKTKSSLLLGLGEKITEVHESMQDLRQAGVDYLVLGQYLRPTKSQTPVAEYVTPEQFDRYRDYGLKLGFSEVVASPLARTSYHARSCFKR
ncbi:lipoyl synthase [Candidatus Altiarchaeota archaeon]